jgi:hypothetical protein
MSGIGSAAAWLARNTVRLEGRAVAPTVERFPLAQGELLLSRHQMLRGQPLGPAHALVVDAGGAVRSEIAGINSRLALPRGSTFLWNSSWEVEALKGVHYASNPPRALILDASGKQHPMKLGANEGIRGQPRFDPESNTLHLGIYDVMTRQSRTVAVRLP